MALAELMPKAQHLTLVAALIAAYDQSKQDDGDVRYVVLVDGGFNVETIGTIQFGWTIVATVYAKDDLA